MTFDYIIVGAGSAGCVLADRLSRDGRSEVLLLEAGSDNRSPYIDMPRGWARLWRHPRYFWEFPVEPEPGRPENDVWAYGKGLGGSSAVNGTMYFRGLPRDYDLWEEQGNEGWNWSQIGRCFREMEDCEFGGDQVRGAGGPLRVSVLYEDSPLSHAIIAAGEEFGLPFLEDVNGTRRLGIGYTQATIDENRHRVTAYTAFVKPVRHRKNLTVMTEACVKRVLFEGTRANGVLVDLQGTEKRIEARSDVILCAGVLQSPKLLQLSGIGPRDVLAAHGIPIVRESPEVGRNMVEHIMISLRFRLRQVPGLNQEFRGWRLARNVLRYYLARRGPLSYGVSEISAFLSTDGDRDWPDLQLNVSPYSLVAPVGEKTESGRGVPERWPGLTITGLYLRPKSRGVVAIRSARIEDPPRIFPNWLTAAEDRRSLVTMVKTLRGLVAQPALSSYVGEETEPGAACTTDEQILEAALRILCSGLHGTGTCRMGQRGDSVVDARLRVHGVDHLRVVDCSVMPTTVSGNTNGPAMAVAMRASELILEDRNA